MYSGIGFVLILLWATSVASLQIEYFNVRNAFPQPQPLPVHRRQATSNSIGISSSGQAVQTVPTYSPSSYSSPPSTTSSSSFTGPVGGESLVSQSTTTETVLRPTNTEASSLPVGGESLVSFSLTTTVAGTVAVSPTGAAAPVMATVRPARVVLAVGIAGLAFVV